MSSNKFYDIMAERHSLCECLEPCLDTNKGRKVVAVDLDQPDEPRESSRWIVYLGTCARCKSRVTYGTGFGGYGLVGLAALKAAAEKTAGASINWRRIDTSIIHATDAITV